MAVTAPLRAPIEIRKDGGDRWFRLAEGVSEQGLYFPRALPLELEGPLQVSFHLPSILDGGAPHGGESSPIRLAGRAVDARSGEEGEIGGRRAIRFVTPEESMRARIARYVEERVPA